MAKKTAAKRKSGGPRAAQPGKARKSTQAKAAKRPAAKAAKRAPARTAAKPGKTAKGKAAKGKAAKNMKPAARAAVKSKVKSKVKVTAKAKGRVAAKAKPKAAARTKVAAARKPVAKAKVATTPMRPAAPAKTAKKAAPARRSPSLDRDRRIVREADVPPSAPSSLVPNRHASAASSGADEMRVRLANHPAGHELAAGDPDVNWQAAETVGDEAPGGDNPTPDQDVVEDIGRALGVQYDDDEELQGGDEIAARDHDRWELDPASSEDFDDR